MLQGEIIDKLRRYKSLIAQKFPLEEMLLYGSYAEGSFRADSDIDVAVVVREIPGDYLSAAPLLWKMRREIDTRIEPLLFEKGKDRSGFLEHIRKTAVRI